MADTLPEANAKEDVKTLSSNTLNPNPRSASGPVSPTARSPRSMPQSKGSEFSTSESDTDSPAGGASSPKSMPLKRGAWSPQEDEKLVQLVETMQPLKWVHVAQEMRSRTSKQCRERYHNYLKPSLTRTPISKEEGRKIEELVAIHGKRWAEISRQLPGRSDNAIKNWWNAGVNRRRASQDQSSSSMMIKQQSPTVQPVQPVHPSSQSAQSAPPVQPVQQVHPGQPLDNYQHKTPNQNGIPSPVQPLHEEAAPPPPPPPSLHVPPPIQVMFSSMYTEQPSSRMQSPMYYAPPAPQPPQPQPQPVPMGQAHLPMPPLPHQRRQSHQHLHASSSPYPLTPSQRAESRAESQARLSVASLSSIGSRSNSMVEGIRSVSPAASPPPPPSSFGYSSHGSKIGPLGSISATSTYSHTSEDPSLIFSRLRQSSEIRRGSVDSGRTDATSLSHYSLYNAASQGNLSDSRRPSLQPPPVTAELATPQENQPSPRQSRLSIANLMNH